MSIRVSPTIPILRGEHRDMVEGTPLFFWFERVSTLERLSFTFLFLFLLLSFLNRHVHGLLNI